MYFLLQRKKMIPSEKIQALKNFINENRCTYLEINERYKRENKDYEKLSSDLEYYLSTFDFDGKIVIRLYKDKRKSSQYDEFLIIPNNPVHSIASTKSDIDLHIKYALLVQSQEYEKKLSEKDQAIAELSLEEEEEPIKTTSQIFLDKTLSGIMQNPNFEKDPLNTILGSISQIAGLFSANHVINTNQVAGVTNSVNEVRKIIGPKLFDEMMDKLLIALQKDQIGTLLKLQKIFL